MRGRRAWCVWLAGAVVCLSGLFLWETAALPDAARAAPDRDARVRKPQPDAQALGTQPSLMPPPKGRWRLARAELERVVLFPAHVLVRHADCDPMAPFAEQPWEALAPPPTRTREAALQRALALFREAGSDPDALSRIAREHSEDRLTAAQGGALGGVSADRLQLYPDVLDGLATLAPGQGSTVVETQHGFHILWLRAQPRPQSVAARRLVIGYGAAAAAGSAAAAPGAAPGTSAPRMRTRAEAEALSARVADALRADPARFDALADAYSEPAPDSARDRSLAVFGTWSTHEPSAQPLSIQALAQVPVGGVSVVDSPLGFQVLLRTAARPVERRYADVIRIEFADVGAGTPLGPQPVPAPTGAPDQAGVDGERSRLRTRAQAEALMGSIADSVAEAPASFARFQRSYCCGGVRRFVRRSAVALGTKPASDPLEALVFGLSPGEVARVSVPGALLLARRLSEAEARAQSVAVFALPAPEGPDVVQLSTRVRGPAVQRLIGSVADEAVAALALSGARAEAFGRVHEELGHLFSLSAPDEGRAEGVLTAQAELRSLLSEVEYRRYTRVLEQRVAAELMR